MVSTKSLYCSHRSIIFCRCVVELEVKGDAGGVWRFPITVDVLESKADDTIVIEAEGLNKETTVGFRLTSMEKYGKLCLVIM